LTGKLATVGLAKLLASELLDRQPRFLDPHRRVNPVVRLADFFDARHRPVLQSLRMKTLMHRVPIVVESVIGCDWTGNGAMT